MPIQDFKKRWDNVMAKNGFKRFLMLLFKNSHHTGKLRDTVLKEAQRIQNKKYQETHKEALKEYRKRYYQNHKEILNAKDRLEYANSEEIRKRIKQKNLSYHERHKEDEEYKAKKRENFHRWYERKKAVSANE